ncbi:hypothetical protein M2399_002150 [Pseudomonas sp. BIGb0450]|uniref:hypothetical protein n=1 Tax=unclassified Pseudomonas TaxID=196821 RepID=UPI002168610D|nr:MULTISPECIES: hypothetical protein [unclassified Pseudomonas]MCS3416938.1 hypothetical protein [Pseudomonas sp. BIGb0558]MCS3436717.1 hypothetical protein [Pseudomonas sp. BIGb0450]
MIYEDVDPQLLAFLHNPMANTTALPPAGKRLNWRSRMLYKIPALRRLICPEQVQSILWEKLQAHLEQARQSLPQYLFEDNTPLNPNTVHRFTDQLSRYFRIEVAPAGHGVSSAPGSDTYADFSKAYTWAALEYTCNRIAENLQLRAVHNLSILKNANLWLCYYLSEIYFLIGHGLLTARLVGSTLHIVPTAKLQRRIKGYWLAEVTEANSKISDTRTLYDMAELLQKHGRLNPDLRGLLVNQTLDKCLSIHSEYLSAAMTRHPKYHYLREIVDFAVHLELRVMLGERTTEEAYLRTIVSPATVDMINSALAGRAPTLDSASSFIEYKGGMYVRGALNFKYGLRKFVRYLLGTATVNGKEADFGQLLGAGFEKDYVLNYIRKLNDPRLEVFGEFKPGNNAKIKGYDIDLIVRDVEEDIYYFIQVKYQLSEIPTYLSEQCQLFLNANFRTGFVRQLAVLRDNICDESIRQKLSQHGLAGAHAGNSHFVLLHNIPFLNFYELDGIFFYEWNLLRNILRDGRVQVRKDQHITEERVLSKPRMHRPQEMVDAYFNQSQSGTQMTEHYDVYCRANTRFVFDELDVICKLL